MIHAERLSFAYDNREVLRDVSFSVADGQLVSVLGMNGAGKSTLLRCLGGLLPPARGSIMIDSVDTGGLDRQQLARTIGYLPQTTQPVDCTVFEAVLIGRRPHFSWQVRPEDLDAVSRLLALTGLTPFADRLTTQLSGGELQRVAIARTLAQEPRLLLLDEPVNHLDIRSQLDTMALIRDLTDRLQIVTIAVTHDLNTALRFSDGYLVLREGRLLAAGGREILQEELFAEAYQLQVLLQEIGGLPVVVPCPTQEPSRHSLTRPEFTNTT